MDELIQLVAQRAGISSDQAAIAVAVMLGYLSARLPSPVVGRISELIGVAQIPGDKDVGDRSVK